MPPPSKRRKTEKDAFKRLEDDLHDSVSKNGSLNSLADLLGLAYTLEDPHDTSKAIYALYRVFVVIISNNKLDPGGDEAAKVVKAWIWKQFQSYVDFLASLLQDEEKFLRTSSLQIMFSLLKHLSSSYTKSSQKFQPQFHSSHFRKIVSALLFCPRSLRKSSPSPSRDDLLDSDVLTQFLESWLDVNDDIRWFFLREAAYVISTLIKNDSPKNVATNALSILERLTTFPTEQTELNSFWVAELATKPPKLKQTPKKGSTDADFSDEEIDDQANKDENDDWRKFFDDEQVSADSGKMTGGPGPRLHKMTIHQSLHSLGSHRAVFTRAWLTLLPRLSGRSESFKTLTTRALNIMHRGILPHLTRPLLVMDWIGECVDLGGSVGLLALNALFVLMRDYNLDYPSFYSRLYAFLDRDVLHLKHRARFFRLTELFLSSTHLPSTLLASFIKRLSRLSLTAPPAAIIMVVPFTYNLLKRHPALMVMIHRAEVDELNDPFLPCETDPLRTQALDSSLWELLSHATHYHAPVSTMCKVFSEAFTKPGYSMEDFLDHTYNTLFETEINRKVKREPALGME
ncbi:CBF-domain-containing protein, partial [Phlegmacium glaucopus]